MEIWAREVHRLPGVSQEFCLVHSRSLISASDARWGPQEYLDAMAPVPNFAGLKFTDFSFHTFQNLLSRSGSHIAIAYEVLASTYPSVS